MTVEETGTFHAVAKRRRRFLERSLNGLMDESRPAGCQAMITTGQVQDGSDPWNRRRNQALEPFSSSALVSLSHRRAASPARRRAGRLDGTRRSAAAQRARTEQSASGFRSTPRTSPPGSVSKLLRGSFWADFHRLRQAPWRVLGPAFLLALTLDSIVSATKMAVKSFGGIFLGTASPPPDTRRNSPARRHNRV